MMLHVMEVSAMQTAILTADQIKARVCYLETIGRVSGTPHEIEIWFASDGVTIWLLSGGGDRADWVRNLRRNPAVRVRIGQQWFTGMAAEMTHPAEDRIAREQVAGKYYGLRNGELPNEWSRSSLPVKIRLSGVDSG
jgi:deazaflavin-dependent oxidoreductase (nitroreductase family)